MTQRNLFNPRDIVFFIALIALVILAFARQNTRNADGERFAQVKVGGNVVWTMTLSTPGERVFSYSDPSMQFIVSDGGAAFVCSDCPDQICVRSGFLSLPGQMAVCVPNRASLLIVEERRLGAYDIDAFAH